MTRPLYIFDVDGTLSLPDHRRHLVKNPGCPMCKGDGFVLNPNADYGTVRCHGCNGDGKHPTFKPDWTAFYDACYLDTVNIPVARVMRTLHAAGAEIWFFTGRTDRVRHLTEKWLSDNLSLFFADVTYGQVVMRKDGDWRADDVIKQEMLNAMLPEDRARLVAVFDDRSRVVQMWRRNGIACFQVAEGNF